jgi:Methyltransferase domain
MVDIVVQEASQGEVSVEQQGGSKLAREQTINPKWGTARRRKNLRAMGVRGAARAAWAKLIFEGAFPVFERLGLQVLPIHFYSPVPDTRQLRRNFERWHREWSFTGIDFDVERQCRLVKELAAFEFEFDSLPPEAEVVSRGFGEGYGEVESRVLHAMLRMLKPRVLVEVGSGVSTFFSANALSINRHQDGVDGQIVCIEPYPHGALETLPKTAGVPIEIIAKPVQDVELSLFQRLDEGDVLFIDSSHVSKLDSDVNRIYLEIIPSLRPGVFVHVHDIPFPYLAPNPQHWVLKKHRFWNEASLLYAFLAYNPVFRIALSLSYLHFKNSDALRVFPGYDPVLQEPSSIWLQRLPDGQRANERHGER